MAIVGMGEVPMDYTRSVMDLPGPQTLTKILWYCIGISLGKI